MANILVQKAFRALKNEGLTVMLFKVKNHFNIKNIYKEWIKANETDILEVSELSYNPMFSVVIPVYNVADNMLRECIDSVLKQTYRNFEIILVDDCSTQESVRTVLAEYDPTKDSANKSKLVGDINIKVIYRDTNGHISRSTNDGIAAANGEFVALCDCDDLYAPNALYEIAKKLNENPEYDYIYSDEDKISEDGKKRRDPFFKPDWSPETFMSYMYTCHISVYRKSILDEVGGLREGFEGSQDYDLVLRVMEKTNKIGHVAKILYHWRMRQESTANALSAKPYILETTRKAKEEALNRRGLKGEFVYLPDIGMYRVVYQPQNKPLVSIIIPSKDNPDVLFRCLDTVCEKTAYRNFEIVLVDNGSNDENKKRIEDKIYQLKLSYENKIKYIYEKAEFNFSHMCNVGAANASGDLLLFLNDDIEVTEAVKASSAVTSDTCDWLSILAGQVQVSYTGAVGCKLFYPGGIKFQHAGVLNLPIGPGHCLYGSEDNLNYYYGRNLLDYNYTVVTGACLMVERAKFNEVGGFDEDLAVAYNDVDLCFKLVKKGYYNVMRNDVALVHHESVSRGLDEKSKAKEERRKREMEKLYVKNPEFRGGYDPCYNPNLVKNKGDFSFDMTNVIHPAKVKKLADAEMPGLMEDMQNDKKIVSDVETITDNRTYFRIRGYAFNNKKKNSSKMKIYVVLRGDNGKTYVVSTKKTYRLDVRRPDGSDKGVLLSGFETDIMKKKLAPGRYHVGVMGEKTYNMFDKYIVVDKPVK